MKKLRQFWIGQHFERKTKHMPVAYNTVRTLFGCNVSLNTSVRRLQRGLVMSEIGKYIYHVYVNHIDFV